MFYGVTSDFWMLFGKGLNRVVLTNHLPYSSDNLFYKWSRFFMDVILDY